MYASISSSSSAASVMVRSHHFVAIAVVGERVENPEVHACGHSHVGCHLVYVVLLYILAPHAIWRLFAVQHKIQHTHQPFHNILVCIIVVKRPFVQVKLCCMVHRASNPQVEPV